MLPLDVLNGWFAAHAAGESHAAAVPTLKGGQDQWRQLVLYGNEDGLIRSVWVVEQDLDAGRPATLH